MPEITVFEVQNSRGNWLSVELVSVTRLAEEIGCPDLATRTTNFAYQLDAWHNRGGGSKWEVQYPQMGVF